MGQKYIIDIPDDKVSDFVVMGSTHFFMPYMMAGHTGHHDTGLPIEPYIKPDFKLIKKKAHDNGYSEGYQDGYSKGMNDYLQKPEVKEESDRAYAHGYSDAESKFSEIRKEAYAEGLKDAAHNCEETCTLVAKARNEGYNEGQKAGERHGMKLAWEAARKIVLSTEDGGLFEYDTRKAVFGCGNYIALKKYSVSEAIEKIRQYEQKQEEIKVGNEVKAFEKKPFIVTGFGYGDDEEDVYCYGFVTENGISTSAKKSSCVRTGRTFPEIAAVLEKMREGQEQ